MSRSPLQRLLGGAAAVALLGPLALTSPITTVLPTAAPIDAEVLAADGVASALVHLADGTTLGVLGTAADAVGVELGSFFDAIDVVHATGPVAAFRALAATGLVARVEHDAPITTFTDSSHRATGGQALLDGAVTGTSVDGAGVGVAVVDSGIDDTHGDLDQSVGANVKVLPLAGGTAVDLPATDVISLGGHGTHVAGTIVGSGELSDGRFHGAATGATVYGVSSGTLISLHSGLEGLQWVFDNHDQVSPAIRVVNNSWGSAGDGTPNPGGAIEGMIDALIGEGVVVVWAAGNSGGDGSAATTSPTCVHPTPGNICVAAYDDQDAGVTDGAIADFSSRGTDGAVGTYPDVAAPGANIVAACAPYLPICATGSIVDTSYAALSGTSMAAPHIAGIVAQILQVAPQLTPGEVELLLEETANPIGVQGADTVDPTNPLSRSTFDAGHGLVDAVEAVLRAMG